VANGSSLLFACGSALPPVVARDAAPFISATTGVAPAALSVEIALGVANVTGCAPGFAVLGVPQVLPRYNTSADAAAVNASTAAWTTTDVSSSRHGPHPPLQAAQAVTLHFVNTFAPPALLSCLISTAAAAPANVTLACSNCTMASDAASAPALRAVSTLVVHGCIADTVFAADRGWPAAFRAADRLDALFGALGGSGSNLTAFAWSYALQGCLPAPRSAMIRLPLPLRVPLLAASFLPLTSTTALASWAAAGLPSAFAVWVPSRNSSVHYIGSNSTAPAAAAQSLHAFAVSTTARVHLTYPTAVNVGGCPPGHFLDAIAGASLVPFVDGDVTLPPISSNGTVASQVATVPAQWYSGPAWTCSPCPAAHYCPDGLVPRRCPAETRSAASTTGSVTLSDCVGNSTAGAAAPTSWRWLCDFAQQPSASATGGPAINCSTLALDAVAAAGAGVLRIPAGMCPHTAWTAPPPQVASLSRLTHTQIPAIHAVTRLGSSYGNGSALRWLADWATVSVGGTAAMVRTAGGSVIVFGSNSGGSTGHPTMGSSVPPSSLADAPGGYGVDAAGDAGVGIGSVSSAQYATFLFRSGRVKLAGRIGGAASDRGVADAPFVRMGVDTSAGGSTSHIDWVVPPGDTIMADPVALTAAHESMTWLVTARGAVRMLGSINTLMEGLPGFVSYSTTPDFNTAKTPALGTQPHVPPLQVAMGDQITAFMFANRRVKLITDSNADPSQSCAHVALSLAEAPYVEFAPWSGTVADASAGGEADVLVQVASGQSHVYFLFSSGRVYGCGPNPSNAQLVGANLPAVVAIPQPIDLGAGTSSQPGVSAAAAGTASYS